MERQRPQQAENAPGSAPAFDFRRLRAVYGSTVPSPPKAPRPTKRKSVEQRRIRKPGDGSGARTSISQELANVKDFRQLLRTGNRRTPRISHAATSESGQRLRAETDRLAVAARQLKTLLSNSAPRYDDRDAKEETAENDANEETAENDEVDFSTVAEASQMVEDMLLAPRTPSPDEFPASSSAKEVEVIDLSSNRSPVENPLLPLQYQSFDDLPGMQEAAAPAEECSDVEWSSDSDQQLPAKQSDGPQQAADNYGIPKVSSVDSSYEKKRVVHQHVGLSPEIGDAHVDVSASMHEEDRRLQTSSSSSLRLYGSETASKNAAAIRMLANASEENVHFVRQKLLMKKRILEIGMVAVLALMVVALALGVS